MKLALPVLMALVLLTNGCLAHHRKPDPTPPGWYVPCDVWEGPDCEKVEIHG